jgi:calcineurin-like phosphoesterase family protein
MAYYFSSDWQLGNYYPIFEYNRPFYDTQEMNTVIIDNVNKSVSQSDTLYFLGNMVRYRGEDASYIERMRFCRERLKCRNIVFVTGNYDARGLKYPAIWDMFSYSTSYKEILLGKISLILHHYPIVNGEWNRYKEGAYHLHGHTMGMIDNTFTRRLDVGVDNVWRLLKKASPSKEDYRPLSLEEVVTFLASR